jgi:hypothetical protein
MRMKDGERFVVGWAKTCGVGIKGLSPQRAQRLTEESQRILTAEVAENAEERLEKIYVE